MMAHLKDYKYSNLCLCSVFIYIYILQDIDIHQIISLNMPEIIQIKKRKKLGHFHRFNKSISLLKCFTHVFHIMQ